MVLWLEHSSVLSLAVPPHPPVPSAATFLNHAINKTDPFLLYCYMTSMFQHPKDNLTLSSWKTLLIPSQDWHEVAVEGAKCLGLSLLFSKLFP